MSSTVAATTIEILAGQLPGPALVRDLLAGRPALAPFFAGHPHDAAAYERKARAVRARLNGEDRNRLRSAIRPLSPGAASRLESILAGNGFVVTTGQQAGLFGGPLYTVHKILSAGALASALEDLLKVPVLPLFWVAADDHDWAEVRHTTVLSGDGTPALIEIDQPEDTPPHAMADRVLGRELDAALSRLEQLIPATEFSDGLLEQVRSAYRPGRTMAAAFESLLADLFRGHDLLLLSSAHPALKEAARPVLLREVRHAGEHARVVREQTERLASAGYGPQVEISDDAANLFFHDEQGRHRLVRDGDGWTLRRTRRRMSEAELIAMLEDSPGRFSPNVLLRPVVESALLPTLAYVGGGAEVSYFAQIGCLFHAHGIEPPLVHPRFHVTYVEARVRRVLQKFGLDMAHLDRPFHELAAGLVRDDLPPGVTESADGMRAALETGFQHMIEAAQAIDPTLGAWLEKQRNAATFRVSDAEQKVARHLRRRKRIELGQLERAVGGLRPGGAPQERVLNVLPFLARHGPDLLRETRAALRVELQPEVAGWTGVSCDP